MGLRVEVAEEAVLGRDVGPGADEGPDVGGVAEVDPRAGDAPVGAGLGLGRCGRDVEHPEAEDPLAPVGLEPAVDRHRVGVLVEPDAAGEEELRLPERAELEDVEAGEEEGAPLGEEEREAIEVDHLRVEVHLGEVGEEGELAPDVVGEPQAHLAAGLEPEVHGEIAVEHAEVVGPLREGEHVGVDDEGAASAEPGHAGQVPEVQRRGRAELGGQVRPVVGREARVVVAAHVEPEDLALAPWREPERGRGDAEFRDPAIVLHARRGLPDHVRLAPEAAAVVQRHEVDLRARRVHGEAHGAAPVEPDVELHGDRVVAPDAEGVAGELERARGLALGEEVDDADVERAFVHEHPHLGAHGRLGARGGHALDEVRPDLRARPVRLVEGAVDRDRSAARRRLEPRPVLRLRARERRRQQAAQKQRGEEASHRRRNPSAERRAGQVGGGVEGLLGSVRRHGHGEQPLGFQPRRLLRGVYSMPTPWATAS